MAVSQPRIRASLRTPRAAGIAGIIFSVFLGVALYMIGVSMPTEVEEAEAWLADPSKRDAVVWALNLIPLVGVAFLWFLGVIRAEIGEYEDRVLASVFLGSGLLFTAMLFVSAAVAAGVLGDPAFESGGTTSPEIWALGRRIAFTVLNVYAMRMGAVFILLTTTIGGYTRMIPRWLVVTGLVATPVLLVGSGFTTWVNLVLPAWALIFSVYLLFNRAEVGRRVRHASEVPMEG
jgi:hypothetical protein